ncbi:MAG: HYR domain-containing protein [Phycisphaerae bacterium]|nr:HYR domain-containing protein [Phycisphaerae bacterium]
MRPLPWMYLWSTSETTQTIDVTVSGTYTCTVTDANGCEGTCSIDVTVNPNPTCSITASPSDTVCDGETVTLDAGAGFASYLWSTSETTQTIDVTVGGTYSCTVTDNNGCEGTCSIDVTVLPLPDVTITPDNTTIACTGWVYTASVPNAGGGATYSWSVTAGATIVSGTEDDRIVRFTADGSQSSFTLSVTVTAGNGCSNSNSIEITVDGSPSGTLELRVEPPGQCYHQDDLITVEILMLDLSCPAAGFQAFIEYDSSNLAYVGGSYTSTPFNLPAISINTTVGSLNHPALGQINLASGVNTLVPFTLAQGTHLLATLTFQALPTAETCGDSDTDRVRFRTNNPPSRFTDLLGVGLQEAPGPGQVTPYILGLVLEDSERIRIDDAGPVMVCPDPVTVECAADIPEPATTVAEFEALDGTPSIDDCSDDADIILTHVDDPADPEECFQGVLTRTYYAEDECGNVSSCVHYITVTDTVPPTINCPPDISVNTDPDECQATIADIGGDFLLLPDEWELFYQANLVAGGLELRSLAAETPPFGAAVWTPSSPMTFADLDTLSADFEMQTGCFIGGSPRFGVGVDCDNDGFTDGYVFIYFGTPPNYNDCPPLNTPQSTGNLIGLAGNVYDTGQVGGTFYDSYANALALVGTCDVTRIVMALDASWNQDQQMLVTSVDINDETYNFAGSAASDNCGIQSVVGVRSDALPLTDPYPLGVTTITWTVTDCAGATDECVQTITVTDAQAPDLTCPENTTIECDESDDPGNTGNATATDNCDVPTVSYTTMYQAALPNFATLASPAGWGFYTQNTASGAPVMGPDTPPLGVGSFHMPTGSGTGSGLGGKTFLLTGNHDGTKLADITTFSYSTYVSTSSLAATHLAPAINLYIDLDDDGDRDTTLVFEPVYVVAEQGAVAQGIWQTWDTLDGPGWWYTSSGGYAGLLPSPGGEFKPLSHYIGLFPDARIVAWFAPGMNFVTGQSSGGIWAGFDGNVDNVTFETNAPSSVTYDFEPTTVSIICTGTITRTWTATDASSNTSTCTQTITVVDTTPPDLTIPADATVDCGESPDPWNTGEATADDNCGTVTVSYSDDRSGLVGCNSNGCDATGVILRTWTAADQCGNQTSQMQTITVIDTAGPIMHDCPDDVTVLPIAGECSAVVTFTEPTATDECYFQGWEDPDYEAGAAITTPSIDWNRYQSLIERVPSGTDGITSMTGSGHGRITALPVPPPPNDWTGAFTRLGGYTNCFGEGFSTRLDIYLDVDDPAVAADTYGWDLSCAASTPAGGHRRDFIFHASGKLGAAYNRILIAGSNNSGFTRRNDLASINHHEVTTSGWYTFEWVFRDFGDGSLAVDLNLRDSSGTLLFTETRHDASDIIGTNVGGNRYMWFTFLEVDTLAIDNTRLMRNVAVSCSPPSGSVFPAGTTTVTCTAVDTCGNESSCSFDVTVDTVMLDVTVELSPTIAPAGTLTRCITFEAWDCTDSQNPIMETVSVPMTFTVSPPAPTISTTVTICLPAHEYSCITARDRLHTLRSTQTVFTPIGPQHYAVDFTGARSDESPPGVGHRLVGGNLNDDPFIDILDYGIWAGQVFTSFGTGDTTCSTAGPHADVSGDGSVGFGDFTFIFVNFLKEHEANCCGQPGFAPFTDGPARRQRPLTRISVAELRRRGMHDAIAGDVNYDGWLDTWDIVLVLLGERPNPLGTPPVPVGTPGGRPAANGADGP